MNDENQRIIKEQQQQIKALEAELSDAKQAFHKEREAQTAIATRFIEIAEERDVNWDESFHFDDVQILQFCTDMRDKMRQSRAKGRGGWDDPEQCSAEALANLFVGHMRKTNEGNFLDLASFLMMLHQRQESQCTLSDALYRNDLIDRGVQDRIYEWAHKCFNWEAVESLEERCHRFLEEALELVQSLLYSREKAHEMVDYVYDREAGDPPQEVGGVGISLSVLSSAAGLRVDNCVLKELERVENPGVIEKIRSKQADKPKDVTV